ncbi:MAG: diacylglycerol kinase family protein [Parcubacteria group bacterium]|nr:diacylglycerol kinase family protein [Parcubacteria group bacterium]
MKQQSLTQSFAGAFRGIAHALKERNFLLQVIAAVVAIGVAILVRIPLVEKAIIILVCALVIGGELVNSALERALDIVSPEMRPEVAVAKELMAAAVLVFSLAAVAIGLLVFGNAVVRGW